MKILFRVKLVLLIVVTVALIALIANCHFAKRKLESHALIEIVEHSYVESFENYKHCVRPMFAANQILALRLWRREIGKLREKCGQALETNDYASEDIKEPVHDLIWSMNQFEAELRYLELVNRAQILRLVNKMDNKYEQFVKAAERFDCFVVRVFYCDEYK